MTSIKLYSYDILDDSWIKYSYIINKFGQGEHKIQFYRCEDYLTEKESLIELKEYSKLKKERENGSRDYQQ